MNKFILKSFENENNVLNIETKYSKDDFINYYHFILIGYFTSKEDKFFDYLKKELKNPYLSNFLKEMDFKVIEKDDEVFIKDKEGIWNIDVIIKDDTATFYISGSYFWIEDKDKKYFYYSD